MENVMKVSIEIRPGEGGEDAKLLVHEQGKVYLRHAERAGLKAGVVQDDHG